MSTERHERTAKEVLLEVQQGHVDAVDRQIINLLRRRLDLVRGIGRTKAALGVPTEQPDRREAVLSSREQALQAMGYPAGTGRAVWSDIHDASVQVQGVMRGERKPSDYKK